MSQTDTESRSLNDGNDAYPNSWEHLLDELTRLDVVLLQHLQQQLPRRRSNPLEEFQGLVLSEEEISYLLTEKPRPSEAELSGRLNKERQLADVLQRLDDRIRKRLAASLKQGAFLALPTLSQLFGLSEFEQRCLVICLAPEVDRKYEKIYAFLQDDVTRKRATVDLALNLLCLDTSKKLAARSAFERSASLLKYQLLRITESSQEEEATPLLSRFLRLDDRIAGFLLGSVDIAPELKPVAHTVSTEEGTEGMVQGFQDMSRLTELVKAQFASPQSGQKGLVLHLRGRYGSGRLELAKEICRQQGLSLLVADARKMLGTALPFDRLTWLLCREAALQPLVLAIQKFDQLLADDDQTQSRLESLMDAIQTFSRVTILMGTESWQPRGLLKNECFVSLECPVPDISQRRSLWQKHLASCDHVCRTEDFVELAGKFRFTEGQIRESIARAEHLARWRSPSLPKISMEDIHESCRTQTSKKLGKLAQEIKPVFGWRDIVLPKDQMQQLRELVHHVKHEQVVMGEWGFAQKLPRGQGLTTMFTGSSGTGKTMAAEVLARELNLDVFKIDLSGVVSKYIGETEKNLNQIFSEAENSNAILFFDEADALFGKRSEVKDAHDRYANIEIAYLLQKMEEYRGVVIMATNLRKNIDEAFIRRMRFIVDFPFPDEVLRQKIWSQVFPEQARTASDLDYRFLARRLALTGGNIRNISVRAAYLAAARNEPFNVINMYDLIAATKREFQKMGKLYSEDEFAPYGRASQKAGSSSNEIASEPRSSAANSRGSSL